MQTSLNIMPSIMCV